MTNSKAWACRLALLMGTASVLVLASAGARAEETAAETDEAIATLDDTQGGAEYGEVVVTADKREVSLQKAPAAITALPAEALEQANIKSAVDLNGVVPGLTVTPNEGWSRVVAIRGVGYETAQNSIAQPSVAFHVDGIYIVNPVALQQSFLDVDRVEVQRGPQGTVYGQNSVGGTLNVVTNKPNLYDYGGTLSAAYGTYNLTDTIATFNVPLIEGELAVRGTFEHMQHDGFAESVALGGYELDDANNATGRAEVLWAPNDRFSATFLSQIYDSNTNDAALKNILDPEPDPRKLTQDYPGWMKTRQYIEALTLNYDFDWASLKSITSYQNAAWHAALDNDRLDLAHYPTGHDIMPFTGQTNVSWTQEVNLTSPTSADSSLDWIVGAFYLYTSNKARVVEYYNTAPNQPTPDITQMPSGGLPSNWGYGVQAVTTRRSYSGYGQGTYHFTDALRFTAGARYTHDEVEGWSLSNFGAYGPASTASTVGNELTGKVALEYDLTDDNMLYASWSRGFKPGGTNLNSNPTLVEKTFESETVDSIEVGSKNRFFGNALTANFAAFHYDYKNFQFISDDPVPYQGGVANIPESEVYGAEAEFGARLPYNLRLDGNATVLHSEVTSDFYTLDSVAANNAAAASGCSPYDSACLTYYRGLAIRNIKGNELPKTPSFAGSLALTHTYGFNDGGTFTSRVQYVYQGDFIYRVFDSSSLDNIDGYGLWNLYFDYMPPAGDWKFSLTATNVFDNDAVVSRFTNAFGIGTTASQYVPPRQVIARVSYSF